MDDHLPVEPQGLNIVDCDQLSRRGFLRAGGLAIGAATLNDAFSTDLQASTRRLKVAAIFTEFTHRSHANVILENFLHPYLFNGKRTEPGMDVVSFYADQMPLEEMSRDVSQQFNIPLFKTIDEALCLGGKELAVDAVLSIGEHGEYPTNDLGQKEYPRKRFFDEIVAVMKRSGRFVPLFSDKHLSYRWDWAKEMYETAIKYGIPLMAGSSVPLAQRKPMLDLPTDCEIEEAVSIHGGPLEIYDFHGLEVLQSMIEFRKGGETGVTRVEFLDGDALWKAADEGRWSREIAEQAMIAERGNREGNLTNFDGEEADDPYGILLTYQDGTRATILNLGKSSGRWNFACRLKGSPDIRATHFNVGPWNNRNLFKALSHAIQHHFREGSAPYPIERTLLTTGILEAAMRSRKQGTALDTPHLEFGYNPIDFCAMREMGDSWKIITDELPEPKGIDTSGLTLKPLSP
ncbi:MAG: hypothetical protein ACKVT0_17865 [Planctomycetaceae bacterium]